ATRRSGQITMPLAGEAQVGGHAVCLVGFQDQASAPGGGYFILRNSWGTTWGSLNPYGAGYGIIPYKYISTLNWEAYTLTTIAISDEPEDVTEAPKDRTITIKLKANVNLVFE